MTRKLNRAIGLVVLASVAAAGVTGAAIATSGSGVSGTVAARGLATDKVKTRGNQPYDAVVQQITIAPGGHTGWHTHHGPVVVVVQSGAVTLLQAHQGTCQRTRYVAGQSFVDPGQGNAHIARNTGSSPAELWATYFDVPPGQPFRLDAADPGTCSF